MRDLVITVARETHGARWRMSGDEGAGDKLAKLVTDTWQAELENGFWGVLPSNTTWPITSEKESMLLIWSMVSRTN